jgi:hypothetical protein
VLKIVVAPMLLFAIGFLPGLFASASMSPWSIRAVVCAVLFSPIAALILLRYFEAVDPDSVSALFLFLPRAIELPLLGLLVGYGLHTLLTVGQATGRGSGRGN